MRRDLTRDEVAALLELQGYRIPDDELTEVTHRLNALMERMRELDALGLGEVEPWPVHPNFLGGPARG